MIFSSAQADSHGNFTLPDLLQRGESYEVLVAADGYQYQVFSGVSFSKSDQADQSFTIPLTKQ
jgi:hypothetical protein